MYARGDKGGNDQAWNFELQFRGNPWIPADCPHLFGTYLGYRYLDPDAIVKTNFGDGAKSGQRGWEIGCFYKSMGKLVCIFMALCLLLLTAFSTGCGNDAQQKKIALVFSHEPQRWTDGAQMMKDAFERNGMAVDLLIFNTDEEQTAALAKAVDEQPEINDVTTYNNGVVTVPTYLCLPLIVDKDNMAAEQS